MSFDALVQIPKHSSSMKFYVKTTKVKNKFTFTCEEIQNQCILNLFITLYFEF